MKQKTTSQRSKEDAQDYRYMPDPDIPPIVLEKDEIAAIQSEVGMLPQDYKRAFSALKLDSSVINTLFANKAHAENVYGVLQRSQEHAARVANWYAGVYLNLLKTIRPMGKKRKTDSDKRSCKTCRYDRRG